MKNLFTTAVFALTVAAVAAADSEIPRQFRVWGRKAPTRLGSYAPIPGRRGIESIRIPKGYKQIMPHTNLTAPAIDAAWRQLGYIPFVTHPLAFTYHVTQPTAGQIGKPVRAVATPGEYVPLSFAIRTLRPINCVEVNVSAFTAKDGKVAIPRCNIDLRRVMDIPSPTQEKGEYIVAPRYLESFDEFDILNVKDATTERFFITVKVPDNATPGIVKGGITVKARNGGTYEFKSAIRILPFKLAVPDPYTEMNFQMLSNSNDPRFLTYGRDNYPDQLNKVFVDMIEHGMSSNNYEHVNPAVKYGADGKLIVDFEKPGATSYLSMNDFLYIVQRAGFKGPFCYYAGPYEWSSFVASNSLKNERFSPKYNQALRDMVKATDAQRQKMNWPKFIYFLGDEPGAHSDRVQLNMNLGKQLKAVLPAAVTSNFFNGEWNGVKDWKILKEVTDINCTNYVVANTIKESKELGYKKLWLFNGAAEYPDDVRGQRIYYGFHPWKVGASGVSQYKYRAFYPDSPNDKNDFTAYDQINGNPSKYDYTYPAADGPIPTQKWEGVRQGIYDYRYLLTLKKMIAAAKNKEGAAEAQKTLSTLMSNFSLDYQSEKREELMPRYSPATLDVYRWQIAQAIMKLQKAEK